MYPAHRTILRDVALVCFADALLAASFGATATAGGLPLWTPIAMSLFVFAGGAQITAASIVLSGGGAAAAVAAAALLNLRLAPYGLTVADITGDGPWYRRLFGAHVTTDETVAFALRQPTARDRRFAYWACGIPLFLSWNAATVGGAIAGTMVSNLDRFGIDSIFPAVMIALALPAVSDRRTGAAAGTGAVAAVALTPVLPAGLPVLASLGGLAWLWRRR